MQSAKTLHDCHSNLLWSLEIEEVLRDCRFASKRLWQNVHADGTSELMFMGEVARPVVFQFDASRTAGLLGVASNLVTFALYIINARTPTRLSSSQRSVPQRQRDATRCLRRRSNASRSASHEQHVYTASRRRSLTGTTYLDDDM